MARHKKKTLLSKLDCSYLKYFTPLLYFFIFTTANKALLRTNISTLEFLIDQYEDSIRWVYRTGVLQITQSLDQQGYGFQINGMSLRNMSRNIQQSYLNSYSNGNLKGFNLNVMGFTNQDLANSYS